MTSDRAANRLEAPTPRLLPAGTNALLVEFGDRIDETVNEAVLALDHRLRETLGSEIREIVPTYRSLLVHFDPAVIRAKTLSAKISAVLAQPLSREGKARRWVIPVCYGGEFGIDLEDVAKTHNITPEEVIALHSGSDFRVYMIGFAPGFGYLGGLDPRLHTSRRVTPRLKVPARSIPIGGEQGAIYPDMDLPSGWHLLGQTPFQTYAPESAERPFRLEPGDRVKFRPIERDEYFDLLARANAGEITATCDDEAQA